MLLRWIAITAVLVAPAAAGGCRGAPPAAPVPQAPPPVPPPPPPAPPLGPGGDPINLCLVQDGRITENVTDPSSYRAPEVPAEYASRTTWYVANEPVTFNGKRYYKYGLPRVLGPRDVVHVGSYRGVAVFAEPDANPGHPEVVFLPVNPACEFQPYQIGEVGGAVRG